MEGGREGGSRKNVRGREGQSETETNLTHHDALNIPNKRLLSPSVAGLYWAREEKKTQYSQLSIKVEFIIQLPAYCWRERAAKHLCHSAQKRPSQYFLIKLLASSRESLHGRSVLSSARFHCECRDTDSCLVYLVKVWCGGWYRTTCQRESHWSLFCILLNPLIHVVPDVALGWKKNKTAQGLRFGLQVSVRHGIQDKMRSREWESEKTVARVWGLDREFHNSGKKRSFI